MPATSCIKTGTATYFYLLGGKVMSATSCMKTDGDDNIFFGGKVMSTTSCTKPDGDSDIFIM